VSKFKVIGKPHPRLDGPDTVSGNARYTVDVVLPGSLHVRLLRSPLAHARIQKIDTSRAQTLAGVAAVLTANDVPAKRFGASLQDEAIFAVEKVRYIGDVIAAVAAENEQIAEQAIALIDCQLKELPAALTTDEALRENAPLLHDQLHAYRMNSVLARDWHPVAGRTSPIKRASAKATSTKASPRPMKFSTILFTPSRCSIVPSNRMPWSPIGTASG
jgi:CO/xanthine dehydrogenase Mo-binding subunit